MSQIPEIELVEVVDDVTVRFVCGFSCPFLGSVTLADLPTIPAHVWNGVAEPETALPVGSGPYRLVSYSAESGYRFEADTEHLERGARRSARGGRRVEMSARP